MESPNEIVPPVSRLSVGSVLGRSISVLGKQPHVFLGLSFLAGLPGALLETMVPGSEVAAQGIGLILGFLLSGAIACAAFHNLQGSPISITRAVGRGMSRFVPLLGASVIAGLGIVLGMLLLIVPGLMLMCVWAVIIPACVVERLGAVDSLTRSAVLTKGYRMPIFGLMLLVMVFNFAVSFGLGFVLLMFWDQSEPLVMNLAIAAIMAIPTAFQYVISAILYYDLRNAREGVSLGSLVSVFD